MTRNLLFVFYNTHLNTLKQHKQIHIMTRIFYVHVGLLNDTYYNVFLTSFDSPLSKNDVSKVAAPSERRIDVVSCSNCDNEVEIFEGAIWDSMFDSATILSKDSATAGLLF